MPQIFMSFQVQYKQSRRDKMWTQWCTLSDLNKCKALRDKFKKIGHPTRLVQIRSEVTILEES